MLTTSSAGAARNLQVTLRAGQAAAEDSLAVIGLMVTNTVKTSVTKPPFSAPGTPPGLRTGGLRLSYKSEVRRSHSARGGKYVAIYSDQTTIQPVPPGHKVDYPEYLEFGTSRMAARPHLRPAVEAVKAAIPAIVASAWSSGVRGSGRVR